MNYTIRKELNMNILSCLDNLQNNLAKINQVLSAVDSTLTNQARRQAEFVQSITKHDNNTQYLAKQMEQTK